MGQFTRYAIVGVGSNLAGYLIYLLLTYFYVGPKFAMTIVYLTGALVSFIGNRQWTFTYRGAIFPTLIKYVLAHACGYSLNFVILYVFVDEFLYPHQAVQAVAIGIVAVFLFLMLKKIVFVDSSRS
jgi:putative flippase GtrA